MINEQRKNVTHQLIDDGRSSNSCTRVEKNGEDWAGDGLWGCTPENWAEWQQLKAGRREQNYYYYDYDYWLLSKIV